jgi:hypothetical protein
MKTQLLKIQLILLAICLSSCSAPSFRDREQCSVTHHYEEIEIFGGGVKKVIIPEKSKCDCRKYHWGLDYIGPKTAAKAFPVEKCNKLTGHSPKEYVGHINDAEAVRLYLVDRSKDEKKSSTDI